VLITGHASIETALEAMKCGASDYLIKPLDLQEMLLRLHRVLNERNRFVALKEVAERLDKTNQELIGSAR